MQASKAAADHIRSVPIAALKIGRAWRSPQVDGELAQMSQALLIRAAK